MDPESIHSGPELERRYRRLLRAYPKAYRASRGDEMLATLLDTAPPGQRTPSPADRADILTGALRERLGINALPGVATGLRIAGPIGLALAVSMSVVDWAVGGPSVLSIVVAVVWLEALLIQVLAPRLLVWAVSGAWLVTLVAAIINRPAVPGLLTAEYGTLVVRGVDFAPQLVCGLLALIAASTVHWRPSWTERIAVVLGAAAVPLLGAAQAGWQSGPGWRNSLAVVPVGLLIVGAVMAATRRSTGGFWAALLVLVTVPVTTGLSYRFLLLGVSPGAKVFLDPGWWFGRVSALSAWGLLFPLTGPAAAALLGTLAIVAVAVAVANRTPSSDPRRRSGLATLAGVSLGLAAGISLYLLVNAQLVGGLPGRDLVALAAPVLAAVVVPLGPGWLRRPLLVAAIVTLLVTVYTGRLVGQEAVLPLVLLLVIAAAAVPTDALVIGGSALTAGALLAFTAYLSLGSSWTDPGAGIQSTAVPAVAAVAILTAPFVGAQAAMKAGGAWVAGTLVFVSGLFWILVQFQVADDMPLFLTLVGGSAIVLLATKLTVRRRTRAA